MRIESYPSWAALAGAYLVGCSVAFVPIPAEAGTLVIPAWAFDRGNAVIHADPAKYADAGPVVGGGERQPWGWRVEYDIEYPVDGMYRLHIQYASAEARPIEVSFDTRNIGKCCTGIGVSPGSSGESTWKSSGARWEILLHEFGAPDNLSNDRKQKAKAGKHTIILTSRKPLPHLVSLRITTPETFPESWQPPQYKVRDMDSIPAKFHELFTGPSNVDVAALRQPVEDPSRPKNGGSLTIPAWTFDRGNVRIYTDPNQYANAGPLVGGGPQPHEEGRVEYDIDFPVGGDYTLTIRYASAEPRPVDVLLDGRNLGRACAGVAFGSAPFEYPVRLSGDSWAAMKNREVFSKDGEPVKLSLTKGRHTLKLARRGPLPNLLDLRLDSLTASPKGWEQPERKMRHMDRAAPAHRASFLPPDAVNIAALRLAIEDTIKTFGPRYAGGEQYLKQLAGLEKQELAATAAGTDEQQKAEIALTSLRREAMLAHPLIDFDKLLFLKRTASGYGHTYTDQHSFAMGGNLCVLSPVSPDGKVTTLVPELEGGMFDRFDLSYDAKKVVFGYKKSEDRSFRIYEIDLDPVKGTMVPGSLRQLTFGSDEEAEAIRCYGAQGGKARGYYRGFDDMDPVYLPDGKILFVSTRSQQNTYCAVSTVTTLYVMDADGKKMQRLSAGPINETAPSVMDDGRVVYTRWEYVDKGLGNGQSLWAIRPDGSGSDHVFKNNTVWPAGMSNARSIPGSNSLVTIGGTHHNTAVGSVILVDTRRSRRGTEAMTCITPEIGYPCMSHPVSKFGFFMDPYPISQKLFIVSHVPGARDKEKPQYGIYVLDAWGNRAELCRDLKLACYEPIPLRPRRKPMKIVPLTPVNGNVVQAEAAATEEAGSLFVQDVYQGMTGIERGRVKYLRVMGALKFPWGADRGMNTVGLNVDIHRKKVYGVVKVHEDGSAYFYVPANENLFFQALDENYMLLQHMPSFINLMPGENKSCIGCHEHRRRAPAAAPAQTLAMSHPIQTLAPQPGDNGPRMVHYAVDVEPILDKHCVSCHGGREPKGRLDLTGVPTARFSRSYENLIGRNLVSYMDCRYGRAHFRPEPPLSFGSHLSKLVAQIRKDPCKGDLTTGEFIKITTWIDANVPYYGTYDGKKELQYKDEPDFRPAPLVQRK